MKVYKLKNLVKDLKRRIGRLLGEPKYDAKKFFKERHKRYGCDLRSVGNCTLSSEENERVYGEAREVFLGLCAKEGVDFENARVIDIGCGTGFYTQTLQDAGVKDYLGVDIIEDRFDELSGIFGERTFRQMDVTEEALEGEYDLVVMIDVTQHIVDDDKFSAAMQNIREHLGEGGVFIVTSWCAEERTKRTYYEIARPVSFYEKEFPGYRFSEIIPFRDKFIFSIRKNASACNCDR